MNRVFYALGLLACCSAVVLAGEVDPEKRGGAARQQQPAGSTATGSAATASASMARVHPSHPESSHAALIVPCAARNHVPQTSHDRQFDRVRM